MAALAAETAVDVVGDLGDELLVGGLGQHAGDVEPDVADTEHGDRLCGRVERPVAGHVGVAVVPVDEVSSAERALELDAGDVEVAVGAGARGEDDGVVELLQVVELEVGAVVDVAEEADALVGEHTLERLDDLLDARVVRRDAVANQAERRRVAVEDVDRDIDLGLGEDVGGVDACRSGTDHSDAQLPGHAVLLGGRDSSSLLGEPKRADQASPKPSCHANAMRVAWVTGAYSCPHHLGMASSMAQRM